VSRKALLSYALPTTVLYSQVGGVGIFTMSDRDHRQALFMRHLDEHGCGDPDGTRYMGGFGHCPEAMRLFDSMHDEDRVILA